MAITDINISEELETNAPSIKYSGNEGPKSPQEMQQKAEYDMQEYIIEFEDVFPEMKGLRGTEEYMEMLKNYFRELTKGPILPSPEDPVNPFGPKPIGPPLPDRQMAAYGGIMGMDGRRQYGIGSSLKKFARKIIPNEVAEIAVKAAPFVAPFNPLAAGLMSGIGSFDQTGRIGSSLKSGLMNYGLGNLSRMAGGAGFQKGFTNPNAAANAGFMDKYLSSPYVQGEDIFSKTKERFFPGKETITTNVDKVVSGVPESFAKANSNLSPNQQLHKWSLMSNDYKAKFLQPENLGFLDTALKFAKDHPFITAAGIYGTAKALTPEQTVSAIMNRGDGMDVTAIRAEVQEAFQDTSGKKLAALRVKYPYLGRADTKDMTAMAADGGRIGFAGGKLATYLAGKKITGSSRTFLEKIFGKEKFKEMATRDPDMHRGMLEVVEMFRNRDKEGLKMYLQKFLPHMDDEMVEDFIIVGGGTEGIQGQLIRLGSG